MAPADFPLSDDVVSSISLHLDGKSVRPLGNTCRRSRQTAEASANMASSRSSVWFYGSAYSLGCSSNAAK
ncbi:hypothetical protein KIN20_037293 [Parelaphostrongylus tenuis]|uniref:F-box domain-containing protein n=1 Tax=Parelaphostrongylus tenuis TaxID=148309 RepID=A0AAD5RE30_PARTN|nr:hypothetical protein KIN20_037293 [Parelaphostrongylus tenuis]